MHADGIKRMVLILLSLWKKHPLTTNPVSILITVNERFLFIFEGVGLTNFISTNINNFAECDLCRSREFWIEKYANI